MPHATAGVYVQQCHNMVCTELDLIDIKEEFGGKIKDRERGGILQNAAFCENEVVYVLLLLSPLPGQEMEDEGT